MYHRSGITLGLTGGVGTGKTTAARCFEACGFRRIDSDAIVREHLLTDPDVKSALVEKFGGELLDEAGEVCRPVLADRVFSSDEALVWLEELLHPRVFRHWKRELEADPAVPAVVEVPLLFEKKLEKWFDFTACVSSNSALQLSRLEQRGLAAHLARKRIARQFPLARKIELADFVLLNDGSLFFLQDQVSLLAEALLQKSSSLSH